MVEMFVTANLAKLPIYYQIERLYLRNGVTGKLRKGAFKHLFRFHSPQVQWYLIYGTTNIVYKLSDKFLNALRFRILGNKKALKKFLKRITL